MAVTAVASATEASLSCVSMLAIVASVTPTPPGTSAAAPAKK
jgi:hypothetical protein